MYVTNAAGALKHVHRGAGLQKARWLDETRMIYEAEPDELRVYDAAKKTTTHTIKNRYGIALNAVSNVSAGEHCPEMLEPLGLDDDDEDPHLDRLGDEDEEPAAKKPVTLPAKKLGD